MSGSSPSRAIPSPVGHAKNPQAIVLELEPAFFIIELPVED
jgi:hypothetical protein